MAGAEETPSCGTLDWTESWYGSPDTGWPPEVDTWTLSSCVPVWEHWPEVWVGWSLTLILVCVGLASVQEGERGQESRAAPLPVLERKQFSEVAWVASCAVS